MSSIQTVACGFNLTKLSFLLVPQNLLLSDFAADI